MRHINVHINIQEKKIRNKTYGVYYLNTTYILQLKY